jgi:hypothetical protein
MRRTAKSGFVLARHHSIFPCNPAMERHWLSLCSCDRANHRRKCGLCRLRGFENDRRRNELSVHCALNSVDESIDNQRLGLNLGRYDSAIGSRMSDSLCPSESSARLVRSFNLGFSYILLCGLSATDRDMEPLSLCSEGCFDAVSEMLWGKPSGCKILYPMRQCVPAPLRKVRLRKSFSS